MEPAKILHPNRTYCNRNGQLIHTIASDEDNCYISVLLGPILSLVPNGLNAYIPIDKLLPRIKLIYAIGDQARPGGGTWYEIEFPKKMYSRLFVALDGIALLFTKMAKSVQMPTVELSSSATELTEEQIDKINKKAEEAGGIMRYHQEERFFECPMSYVFENQDQASQFKKDMMNLGLS